MSQHPLTDAIRRAAREGQLRFNDRGQLVPAAALETEQQTETDDQLERVTQGSGDGGQGLDVDTPGPRHRPASMNDLIRRAVEKGY